MVVFADDINIFTDKNIGAVQAWLNWAIKQVETLFQITAVSLILIKKKAMLFHLNKTCKLFMPKLSFKNVEISYTSEVKFLGINTSNNLKWNTHSQFLCSKLYKVSYMILSLKGDLSLVMLGNTYFKKFQFLIRYGKVRYGVEKLRV